jgi:hypothetical protein
MINLQNHEDLSDFEGAFSPPAPISVTHRLRLRRRAVGCRATQA